jgi:hypothetical protein
MYGLLQVTKKCKDWLEKNLKTTQCTSLLREISYQYTLFKELNPRRRVYVEIPKTPWVLT